VSENKKAPVFVGAEDGRSYIVKNTGSRTRLFGNPAILSAFSSADWDP
jgi:type IV secretory pathway TraG/TraD family ATPase VirD4